MAAGLTDILRRVEPLARQAGEVLLHWHARLGSMTVGNKGTRRDLVTSADLQSEELLIAGLREAFPDDGFFAEESGVEGEDREHVWYIDPLDGTVNFVHGLPLFAVSIARVTNGRPDVAIVHLPVLGETFTAVAGGGAFLGEQPLSVSPKETLQDALLATGFPYKRQTLLDNNLENFNRLFLRARGVRRMGSAAIDLAYVAAGRLDVYWELHLGPYDVAAGGLLITEAGGSVDTIECGGDWIHGRNVIAGSEALASELRGVLLEGRAPGYPPLGEREEPAT